VLGNDHLHQAEQDELGASLSESALDFLKKARNTYYKQ
jgi:hypothetical protein